MSDSDSFIEEVNDELRRDRLFGAIRRYGWIVVLVVLAIVAGATWNEYSKARAAASAQAFGDAILAALENDSAGDRIAALQQIETDDAGQVALIGFIASSEAAAEGDDSAGAADLLANVGGEGLNPIYQQLATFKRLMLETDSMEPADRREGFRQLAAPGAPLRLLAEEQIALTYVEEGDNEKALETLQSIQADAEATQGLQQRTSQLIVALGGTPAEAG
ncbi:hypothetical protein [Pseudooceanicola algae]|uniref:Tetratricopeptide repeat-like domain-containing protein n=1 Tax=Pseudooceanicola algae TaxID=1537215 RepID=A0A418SC84_9RHOB|nr:hypothetical protein [Pseudooceanicola algae]QPM89979.1 hypothetical protein PSAL_012100 [Pseudooceanicola algae]